MSIIRKEILALLTAQGITKPLELVKAALLLRYLAPEMMGLLNIITQVASFAKYGDLGFSGVVQREFNFYRVQEPLRSKTIIDVAYTSELTVTVVLFLLILGVSFFYTADPIVFIGVIAAAFLFLAAKVTRLHSTNFQINKNFYAYAKLGLATTALTSFFVAATVPFLGVYSPILIPVGISALVILFLQWRFGLDFEWNFDLAEIRRQLKVGLQLGGLTFLTGLAMYAERYLIVTNFGLREVGFYAMSAFMLGYLQGVAYNLVRPVIPRLQEALGEGNKEALWRYAIKPTLLLVPIALVAVMLMKLLIPLIVTSYFTKYIGALPAFHILIFSSYFVAVNAFCGYLTYSPALNKIKYTYASHITYIVALVIFSYIFLHFQNDLLAIAKAIVVSYFLKTLLQNAVVFRFAYSGFKAVGLLLMINILPMAFFATSF